MKTDLAKTLSIRGQHGLFTYIAQSRGGAIVESLEDKKRSNFAASAGITTLEDISIYTEDGALAATLAMVGVSIAFSLFIGASARYPLVYGSLASVILLMFWLYTACVVIYCGAAVNIALRNVRDERQQRRFAPEKE